MDKVNLLDCASLGGALAAAKCFFNARSVRIPCQRERVISE